MTPCPEIQYCTFVVSHMGFSIRSVVSDGARLPVAVIIIVFSPTFSPVMLLSQGMRLVIF